MSQEELAEKLEVSRQTVSNWENDKAVLDAEKLAKLCKIFGVSADDMLNGEGLPAPQEQETTAPKNKSGKRLVTIIFFAIVALTLIVIAAVGFIFFRDDGNYLSSFVIVRGNYIWIVLLVLGVLALAGTVVAFFKKK
ncbi:MAG: helix-turn-helix domain-containing protein [Clostridia bacterium]|nr:helix-turn-helix domain-containing protein [Clostridia bacterium]